MAIVELSNNLVRLKGPTDPRDGTVLDQTYLTAETGTVVMRMYDEAQEQSVAFATTRAYEDTNAASVTLKVPHTVPQWIEANDLLEIWVDGIAGGKQWLELTVAVVTPTSTDYDTLIFTPALPDAIVEGAEIRLVQKDSGSDLLPLEPKIEDWDGDANAAEFTTGTGISVAAAVGGAVIETVSFEDGDPAKNQPTYKVSNFASTIGVDMVPGDRLRSKIASDITMTEYGDSTTWTDTDPTSAGGGFEAAIPADNAYIRSGRILRAEVVLDADSVEPLKIVKSLVETITEG